MNLLPLWTSLNGKFIVGETNSDAFNAIHTWPNNIIILYGSWGKSLLASSLKGFQYENFNNRISGSQIIWDNFPTTITTTRAFHNINDIISNGYKLCITMKKHPQECNILPLDLKSRMSAAYCVKIKPPNLDLRQKIVVQWLQNGGIDIEQHALEYLFRDHDGSLHELAQVVKKLHEFALEHQKQITIQCIKNALDLDVHRI